MVGSWEYKWPDMGDQHHHTDVVVVIAVDVVDVQEHHVDDQEHQDVVMHHFHQDQDLGHWVDHQFVEVNFHVPEALYGNQIAVATVVMDGVYLEAVAEAKWEKLMPKW